MPTLRSFGPVDKALGHQLHRFVEVELALPAVQQRADHRLGHLGVVGVRGEPKPSFRSPELESRDAGRSVLLADGRHTHELGRVAHRIADRCAQNCASDEAVFGVRADEARNSISLSVDFDDPPSAGAVDARQVVDLVHLPPVIALQDGVGDDHPTPVALLLHREHDAVHAIGLGRRRSRLKHADEGALPWRLGALRLVSLPQGVEDLVVIAADVLEVAPADRAGAAKAAAAVNDHVDTSLRGTLDFDDEVMNGRCVWQHSTVVDRKSDDLHPLLGLDDEVRDVERLHLVVFEKTDQQADVVDDELVEVFLDVSLPVATGVLAGALFAGGEGDAYFSSAGFIDPRDIERMGI